MIGILSSNDMEEEYSKILHSLFKNYKSSYDEDIVVFTTLNINLQKMEVAGTLISQDKLHTVQVPLPSIIFNFSLQRESSGIKVRKALEEMEGVTLINYINKFDQWMIMDMISSNDKVKSYLLPYFIYDKAKRDYRPEEEKKYITMPSRGASLSRVIYAEPDPDPESDIVRGSQYFKKGHITDYIDASLCQRKWLFIEIPDIVLHHNHPLVCRIYMQKSNYNRWDFLKRILYPDPNMKVPDNINLKHAENAAKDLINEINNFLPSIGHCFIDMIFSQEGKAYFLHLGGLDQYFFKVLLRDDISKKFYKNIISLSRYYRAT
ncbi:MAG: hypothetical protein GX895_14450 [Clostridiales bacterium]|uniref:hypothetical protein n=1 Tax=Clostridium sp. N3C TaxID=1776758 RepID=UPI001177EADE|nr:hypothetical protein [Clostridium sp. N3C]NLZ49951.1 hypothetical protein [Clostridiales bacterium]